MYTSLQIGESIDGVVRAARVYTGDELLQDAALCLRAGRLVEILPASALESDQKLVADYPDALIHPGLVNAHSHLDLTGDPIPHEEGSSFTFWLENTRGRRLNVSEADLADAARAGTDELIRDGVTCVVDFSFDGLSEEALRTSGLNAIVLRELIGLDPERWQSVLETARVWLDERKDDDRLRFGVAPHAPYSVAAELAVGAKKIAADRTVAMHVAEDPEEREFLTKGTGPFREFLERLGIDERHFPRTGEASIPYLDRLGALGPSTLLIHANDLTQPEVEIIAKSGGGVVFCPGTHRHFDRPAYPLPALRQAGVPVALGTDSSASNTGLSIQSEMRELRRLFPEFPSEKIFALGTARGLSSRLPIGLWRRGESLDFAVTRVDLQDPLEAFVSEGGESLLTVARGKTLWAQP